ncbi:MAG TPA: S41 family peptidase [Candidatus Acidoferrum sp.]|jgi:C-terminal processing protease CtpA/Prc
MQTKNSLTYSVKFTILLVSLVAPAFAQQFSDFDRERAQQMLKTVGDEVRKHYFDPKFKGVDLNAELDAAKQRIAKVNSMNMALSNIAAALDPLDDSHTFFLPPQHAARYDAGWLYQMIGDRCFVTQVRPKSDADAKGVKIGDELLSINGITPTRDTAWKLQYLFGLLRPQRNFHLGLQDLVGKQRLVDAAAMVRETKRLTDLTGPGGGDIWNLIREEESYEHQMRVRYTEYGDDLIIVKFPEFDLAPSQVGELMDKVRKRKALILDLRGNPGGSVETLSYLAGGFFEKDVKIADRVGRKDTKPQMTKGTHNAFKGKVIVLLDSESASAAEVFAKLMQIEKRGVVMGDRSSGSVMEARHYSEKVGTDTSIFYGVSVTDADIIMTDGKSLEHVGVAPDEIILPTPADLASGRDPVLAHAAETLGVKISPEIAGRLFPYEWREE